MNLRVLVADDDEDVLALLVATLKLAGHDVTSATTGAELLEELAEDGPYDLVITDIRMPWMTGLQVAHSAKEAGLDVPVIVITGMRGAGIVQQVAALGGKTKLLYKPFGPPDLEDAIAEVVSEWPRGDTPHEASRHRNGS